MIDVLFKYILWYEFLNDLDSQSDFTKYFVIKKLVKLNHSYIMYAVPWIWLDVFCLEINKSFEFMLLFGNLKTQYVNFKLKGVLRNAIQWITNVFKRTIKKPVCILSMTKSNQDLFLWFQLYLKTSNVYFSVRQLPYTSKVLKSYLVQELGSKITFGQRQAGLIILCTGAYDFCTECYGKLTNQQLFFPDKGPFVRFCLGLICLNLMWFTCFWVCKF